VHTAARAESSSESKVIAEGTCAAKEAGKGIDLSEGNSSKVSEGLSTHLGCLRGIGRRQALTGFTRSGALTWGSGIKLTQGQGRVFKGSEHFQHVFPPFSYYM
jgi:hypothetical protein